MNLLYGKIVEIASEDGMRVGKIRVSGPDSGLRWYRDQQTGSANELWR
jgi:hypothetical protein